MYVCPHSRASLPVYFCPHPVPVCMHHIIRAFVAEWLRRQTEDLKVPGSIPGGGIFFARAHTAASIHCREYALPRIYHIK